MDLVNGLAGLLECVEVFLKSTVELHRLVWYTEVMRLQHSTIEDMKGRVQAIQIEREHLEARMRALNAEHTAIMALLDEYADPGAENEEPRKRTRSDHIKEALKSTKQGSPGVVAEEMVKLGWKWNGDANPSSIVAIELSRLSGLEGSGVKRVARGFYRFVGET